MKGLNAVSLWVTVDSKMIRSSHNSLVIFSVMIISYILPVADKINKIMLDKIILGHNKLN